VGDLVAIGCMVDTDRTCDLCKTHQEQHCANRVLVYGGDDKHLGGHTFGGFSEGLVADEDFVLSVPTSLDPAAAAPLLCAGITVYSPLRRYDVKGKNVGIVGLGGLGHLGLKFAKALGAKSTVLFTRSAGKEADAKRLGADEVVLTEKSEELTKRKGKLDYILDTVSANHDINVLIDMLSVNGVLCLVGAPPINYAFSPGKLLHGNKSIVGSNIGGLKETQEMLDLCGKHGIVSDIEVIPMQKVNEAFDRVVSSDVKYRFVIDLKTLAQ